MKLDELLIAEDKTVLEAMRRLDETGHRILFVAPGGKLEAVITDSDVRRHILRNFQTGNQLQYAHEQIVDALARRDKAQLILAINHHFNVISANMEQNL